MDNDIHADHFWITSHHPDGSGMRVRICRRCQAVDWADLDEAMCEMDRLIFG